MRLVPRWSAAEEAAGIAVAGAAVVVAVETATNKQGFLVVSGPVTSFKKRAILRVRHRKKGPRLKECVDLSRREFSWTSTAVFWLWVAHIRSPDLSAN